MAEIADAALVSRAPAYRYFPTGEYLLSEVALNSIPEEVDAVLEAAASADGAEVRLDAVVQAIQERTVRQAPSFRTLLRLSLEQPFEESDGQEVPELRRRGGQLQR